MQFFAQNILEEVRLFKRAVYIASVGYSGSTLLDMLLGANDGVTTLGEVGLLARYARAGGGCTCGEALEVCGFWSAVEKQLKAKHGLKKNLKNFDLTVEEVSQTIFRILPNLTDVGLITGNKYIWDIINIKIII